MTNIIHIMLDLETWGTEPGCDIRSIGACVFNPLTGFVHDGSLGTIKPFYIATDNPIVLDGSMTHRGDWDDAEHKRKYPLTRDPRTVQWWSEQSVEAQAAFANVVDLHDALLSFVTWLELVTRNIANDQNVQDRQYVRLWSHGPAFDPPILAAAYKAVGLPVPWYYRAPRDTRTAFDMAGVDDHSAFLNRFSVGTYHHALDDAICQARAVCEAFAMVRPLRTPRVIDNIADPSTLTAEGNAIRDATLDHAAKICREITSWGLSPTKLEVADNTKAFCSKVILAQRSDSPELIKHEAGNNATD